MTEPEFIPLTGYFSSLRYRNFRFFWIARLISHLGTSIQNIAMAWTLYELTGSAFQLGLNGLFRAVPTILFGLLAGTIADRFERRRMVLIADSILFFMPLMLGIMAQLERLEAWHIYMVTFLSAIVDTVGAPARQALYPNLVPVLLLPNAIALNSVLRRVSVLVGPALAGILITLTGIPGAFYANSLSYLAAVMAVFMMRNVLSKGGVAGKRLFQSLMDGLRYIRSEPVLLSAVFLEAFISFFGINQVFLTIFAKDIFDVGPSGLGLMFSVRGAGGVIGSMWIIVLSQIRHQGRVMLISSVVFALSLIGFGLSSFFPAALFFLFLLALADTISGISRQILLQTKTQDRLRGRANSVFQVTGRGLTPLGHTQAGILIPLMTASGAVLMGALAIFTAALGINAIFPQLRRFVLKAPKT
ncbi:MAG: MFS transporter [Candidatus Binatia bacterium]